MSEEPEDEWGSWSSKQEAKTESEKGRVSKIIGFDDKTVWVVHEGFPVVTQQVETMYFKQALTFFAMNDTIVPGQDEDEQRYFDRRDVDEEPGEPAGRPRQREGDCVHRWLP